MRTYSTRIRHEDFAMLSEIALKTSINKSELVRMCLGCAARTKAKPRSEMKIPIKDLKEFSFCASEAEMLEWRTAAYEQKLSFHLWLRECAMPLLATEAIHELPEDDEIADPVSPIYSNWRAIMPVVVEVKVLDGKKRAWLIAARAQKMSLNKWIVSVLDQAAPYYTKNPKS